ncbi:MAG: bifunctional ADP-dependent NAD(P)H-hydrate dehydratase/NAD(P)H-hydrate epimerase, partial [Deltaproteobacteria bacterium]|nr:bifunctional ADP-dependent NAD(P)H-hydrate dehydratase/NAD(P)H-hydrate epimerase [Deltaproteobacteria bacterium]
MYLFTANETRIIDTMSIREGISATRLMNRAARAVFDLICKKYSRHKKNPIVILCGPGNNGGDGVILERLLRKEGWKTVIVKSPPTPLFQRGGIIVDALFGTGLSRPITGFYRKAIEWANKQNGVKVAVDIPSGLSADTGKPLGPCFKADITITFGYPKIGFFSPEASSWIGELHVADIGLSKKAVEKVAGRKQKINLITRDDLAPVLLPRLANTHKGTYGHVMTIACSTGKIGAGILAAEGALRAGAGLSTLILPEKAFSRVDPEALEIMYEPMPGE